VVLVPAAAVGADGLPVNVGEAREAFNNNAEYTAPPVIRLVLLFTVTVSTGIVTLLSLTDKSDC
jgi:hypothetical protein